MDRPGKDPGSESTCWTIAGDKTLLVAVPSSARAETIAASRWALSSGVVLGSPSAVLICAHARLGVRLAPIRTPHAVTVTWKRPVQVARCSLGILPGPASGWSASVRYYKAPSPLLDPLRPEDRPSFPRAPRGGRLHLVVIGKPRPRSSASVDRWPFARKRHRHLQVAADRDIGGNERAGVRLLFDVAHAELGAEALGSAIPTLVQ